MLQRIRFVLSILVFATASARGAVLVSTMANTPASNDSPQSTFWLAQKFTTDAQSWNVTTLQFRGAKNNAGQPYSIFLYSDSGSDQPLAQLGSFDTSTLTATLGTQSVTPNAAMLLSPSTSYWIVMAPGDINTGLWSSTSDTTVAGSGTIPATFAASTTSGASWISLSGHTNLEMMEIDATVVLPPDTAPDAFTFTDQTDVPLSTTITSNSITVSGINSAAPISVTGGTYSINGGAFTSVAGTVNNGDSVRVQHTSSASFSTNTDTTLTIGGVSDTFTSTTLAQDTTPDAFTFTDQTDVPLSTTITSNSITVSGINSAAPISVAGGTYSINGGAFTSVAGSVNNGDSVRVQHTSSSSFSTNTDTTLTIGGVSDTFTSTTLAQDTTPDAFTFTDQTDVPLSTTITSNSITVSGINSAAPISVTGGAYSINGGAFTSVAGTVNNGDSVRVQHTSSASFSTNTDTTLTIGGVSDTFTSTTLAQDTTPDAFIFIDKTNVVLSSTITSNSITVSGINGAAPISVAGGAYSINGGAFTSVAGTVNNGDSVRVQHTSAATNSTTTNTVLTIGGVSDTFSSTTAAAAVTTAVPALDTRGLLLLAMLLAAAAFVALTR